MRYWILFSILFLSIVFFASDSHAQDLGETERYRFFIGENKSNEIIFQSYVTKFNNLIFDADAQSIIVTVETDSTLIDTIFVYFDKKSFDELFSKERNTLPSDMLILLDRVEQEYEIIPTSLGEDLIIWKFNNIPHITEIELIRDPNVKEKNPEDEYPYGLSPLKQITNGSPIHVVKCKDDGALVYKFDMTSVACVSENTQTKLVQRGWGVKTIEFSFQKMEEYLCDKYQGNWTDKTEVCENITQKQCSLMRGIFQSPLECQGLECTDNDKVMCYKKNDSYYQQIEGKEISIDGVIIDSWGGSKHRYHFFTNEPYMKFNTGSGGIKLEGLNQHDGLNGKIVRLSGEHTERDLSIKVNDFEILGSLFPIVNPNSNSIYDASIRELTTNPDFYYNQTIRVAGILTEYEHDLILAGVGCSNAKYITSEAYSSDFPSSRHLNDGEKKIGVRIESHDDLGKVKEFLPSEYKDNPVEMQGLFVPNLIEIGTSCDHVIHKSGYLLTEMENIRILKPSTVYELKEGGNLFRIKYEIKGGTVEDMVHDNKTNSLTVVISSTDKGNLILDLPRDLLDAKLDYCPPRHENAPDDEFFVVVNNNEVDFDELFKTSETRTLKIPFSGDSVNIEIIATCFV